MNTENKMNPHVEFWIEESSRINNLSDPAQKADELCRLSNHIFEVLSTSPILRGEFTEAEFQAARTIRKECGAKIEALIPVLQPIWDAEKKSQTPTTPTTSTTTMDEFLKSNW